MTVLSLGGDNGRDAQAPGRAYGNMMAVFWAFHAVCMFWEFMVLIPSIQILTMDGSGFSMTAYASLAQRSSRKWVQPGGMQGVECPGCQPSF